MIFENEYHFPLRHTLKINKINYTLEVPVFSHQLKEYFILLP